MDKNLKRILRFIFFVTIILSVICFIYEHVNCEVQSIKKNNYGEGDRKETFEVEVEDQFSKDLVEIKVPERQYTQKETKQILKEVMDQIEKIVLGENQSADHIEYDLNFVQEISGYPVMVTWESNKEHIIDSTGKIQEKELTEQGTLVEIKGTLSCGKEQSVYLMNVVVYPKTMTKKEKVVNQIMDNVKKESQKDIHDEYLHLPDKINGKTIIWKKRSEHKSGVILILGMLSILLLIFRDKEQKENKKRARKKQMEADYPNIVNQLSLLIEAGMNVKNAWQKIVSSYEEEKQRTGIRYAYEEMNYTLHEMKGGKTESECYENFGRRCQVLEYMKLSSLLSQNLRKGMKGISKLLSEEAEEAFTMRKLQAVKAGEEAGTKLLFPMSMMLVIVLIIVMVPAFLSLSV